MCWNRKLFLRSRVDLCGSHGMAAFFVVCFYTALHQLPVFLERPFSKLHIQLRHYAIGSFSNGRFSLPYNRNKVTNPA